MYQIALIQSCWHKDIVDQFKNSFSNQIESLLPEGVQIEVTEAPGVVEIPLLAKLIARQQRVDAIVVAGLIVDHGVYRHEFVAQSVMDSLMTVQMDSETPVIYGILTAQDFMSEGRDEFFFDHFVKKGLEAANACAKTLHNIEQIKAQTERCALGGTRPSQTAESR